MPWHVGCIDLRAMRACMQTHMHAQTCSKPGACIQTSRCLIPMVFLCLFPYGSHKVHACMSSYQQHVRLVSNGAHRNGMCVQLVVHGRLSQEADRQQLFLKHGQTCKGMHACAWSDLPGLHACQFVCMAVQIYAWTDTVSSMQGPMDIPFCNPW